MATGPMGELKPGMRIDCEWLVEDMYRVKDNGERVWVLKHLTGKIQKYMNHREICKLFTGKPGR